MMRRRRLTLIEVVVIVGILGILIGLLLPVTTSNSHGVARRLRCASNLRQVMIAASSYEMAMHVLPPTSSGFGGEFSMKALLLPYMDESERYSSLNFNQPHDAPANTTVQQAQIGLWLCPSDSRDFVDASKGSQSYPNNIGTYLNHHNGKFDGPAYELGGALNGRPITLADVTDGKSTTVMFSEWTLGSVKHSTKPEAIYWSTDPDTKPIPLATLATNCEAATVVASDAKGSDWLDSRCGKGGGYSHIMPPNARACFFANGGFARDRTLIGASSHHRGGVNVALLDGSVRFIDDSVAPLIWQGLGTIAGGERVSVGDQ